MPLRAGAAARSTGRKDFDTLRGQTAAVERLTLQGTMIVLEYVVNLAFESGHVFEDALTGAQPYTEVIVRRSWVVSAETSGGSRMRVPRGE